jgi:hypothetical protein
MGRLEMIDAFVAAVNARQCDTVADYLADDFMFAWTNSASGPSGKQGYLSPQKAWVAAAPDYRLTWEYAGDEGDTVRGATRMEGTQMNTLTLPGLPPIPATGRRFSLTYPTTVTCRADKIAAISLGPSSLPSLLEQLGVQRPG